MIYLLILFIYNFNSYQFSLDLTADGKLTFHCSNQNNTLSTDENLKSIETVIYDKVNVAGIVRRHNEFRLYLNNGLNSTFRTKEILKCFSYEADDENSSNGNQIYFRLGAMTNSGLVTSNEFDGSIERFIFKLEAFDESVVLCNYILKIIIIVDLNVIYIFYQYVKIY